MSTTNLLGIDYGQKNIGTAISVAGVIEPKDIFANNPGIFTNLKKTIKDYQIQKIVLGYTESKNKKDILLFKTQLEKQLFLEVELIDENLSTKEAVEIYKNNRNFHKKHVLEKVDSIAAAVLLSRHNA